MSLRTLTDTILARLEAQNCKNPIPLDHWSATPPGPYTLVMSDPGQAFAVGYDGASTRATVRWQVMCCSNSTAGVQDMVKDVRDALTDFCPGGTPESGRLTEEFSGPLIGMEDSPLDVRFSMTLNYVMTTTRGEL